jgi:hypothetical protein
MQAVDNAQSFPNLPLRDIHLPTPPSWWPPAIGWWLLLGLLVVVFALLWFLVRRFKQLRYRKQALLYLNELEQNVDSTSHFVAELSTLLRRSALCAFPDTDCASLSGSKWLEFLDQNLADTSFTTGVGRCLADGPYQPEVDIERKALIALCRRWLKKLPPAPRKRRER